MPSNDVIHRDSLICQAKETANDAALMMSASLDLLEELTALVSTAALAILKTQGSPEAPQLKADHSPVTAADFAAQSIILDGLARLLPGVPVVSEEALPAEAAALGPYFVLVDPLDGTKEFLAGRDEFTINVAVVADGAPALGIRPRARGRSTNARDGGALDSARTSRTSRALALGRRPDRGVPHHLLDMLADGAPRPALVRTARLASLCWASMSWR